VNSGDNAARKKKEEGRTCGGFEAVLLAVADRRTARMVVGLSSSLRFFSSTLFSSVTVFSVFLLLPASFCCFSFLLLFLTVALLVAKELLSRLSGCGNQCCCFSSFSRCCSREGKWWEADGGAASGC
jgi:hypothetical protein